MAQGLMAALGDMAGQPQVDLVSEFRSWDGKGDETAQQELLILAEKEITRILALPESTNWQIWVTYHNYYKAPDLLGPAIAAHLNIPYILIEASRSRKRLNGPWAQFAKLSEAACDAAHSIFYMTDRDRPALEDGRPVGQALLNLPPFLNQKALPAPSLVRGGNRVLLAVGMLRAGDKFASYQVLADTLRLVKSPWVLRIAGDGPQRDQVRALFAEFDNRVEFMGQLSHLQVTAQMTLADLFVWPGVNEAFGMVYLEAQSHGLPVIAQDRPGVRDVIGKGGALVAVDDLQAYAQMIDSFLIDEDRRKLAQSAARHYIKANHLLPAATQQLEQEISRLLKERV